MPTAVSHIGWPNLLSQVGAEAGTRRMDGAVPILTRLVIENGADGLSPFQRMTGRSRHEIAHVRDEMGEVDRIYMNMWVELDGGAGKVFAEHVFTRLFAPPDQRKVRALDGFDPGPVYLARSAAEVTHCDWKSLGESIDPVEHVFGLAHTDTNQHVNSLVYPRYFEDAALRRIGKPLLGRSVEVMFKKPLFAGQRARFQLHTYQRGDEYCVTGSLLCDGKPHTFFRLLLA